MGPWGLIKWHHWLTERKRKKEDAWRTDNSENNKHEWQEVTKDNRALISNRAREAESDGHAGWVLHPEGDFLKRQRQEPTRSSSQTCQSPRPSVISRHRSSQWGRGREMKRPHDYSSPDSDTDEFIDVGQEDSYWWASFSHTWDCNTFPPVTFEKKITWRAAVFSRQS